MGSRTSPYLQEKLALLGSLTVFNQVPELLEKLLGIKANQSQTYRVCQSLSMALDVEQLSSPSPELAQQQAQPQQLIYGMVDGSMVFTDDGWQETKLGRVFGADLTPTTPNRPAIESSEYVAHRGHYSGFTPDFERLLPPQCLAKKVFITDGAEWIGHWLSATYPTATHILDYFHVVEKLAMAAKELPNAKGTAWLRTQQEHLLADQSQQVEINVALLSHLSVREREKLGAYLSSNRHRMRYGSYRQAGLLIGSGPIEAAHRTVLQVRMKRSGQRWVDRGCDNMVRLRVAYKSDKFHLVTDLLKTHEAKF